jgi:lysophospholipase L1-like esterase
MRFREARLLAACALALAALDCSQASAPGARDSGAPGTGGSSTTSSGSGGSSATGGTVTASPTGGIRGTGGAGGAVAAGGTTATGGATATGGTARTDAAAGGQLGAGGTTSSTSTDAGPPSDARPDGATDANASDTLGSDSVRDTAMADKPSDLAPDLPQADSGSSTCNLTGAATSSTPTVYVIGDSTASIYAGDLYPRMGWAQPLQDFFAPACATIADKALSGRSSKSFYDEGSWTPIKNALRKGDYVLVQFGHNDEKTDDAARGTDPYTTFQQYLSIYIDDSLAKGATPILLSPINRNNWSGTTLKDTHGEYPPAMRDLAQQKSVALVDATALTKTYFERIGQAATTKLFLTLAAGESPNYPDGVTDNTHLQEKGARTIAQMVLADLYRQGLAPGTLAKTVPTAP